MKVVIHAGVHRTGTTSLQTMLAKNRAALAESGAVYPGRGPHHQDLAWALKRGEAGAAEVEALLEEARGAGTAVLSGEDFCTLTDLGWLKRLAGRHELRAVFYLRRQDHWLNSWYNQHVKWPFDRAKSRMSPQAFLDRLADFPWLDYAAVLARWEAALGPGRVEAAVVEPGQVEDVALDFLDRLGVPPGRLEIPSARANDSLPVHMLEIARHLGLHDLPPRARMRALNALRAGLAEKGTGAKTVYSPAQRRAVLERFAPANRAAARRFFGREALFLERPPAEDDPWFRFPELSREELLRDWAAPVIRALVNPAES